MLYTEWLKGSVNNAIDEISQNERIIEVKTEDLRSILYEAMDDREEWFLRENGLVRKSKKHGSTSGRLYDEAVD